jgi:ABC-type Zn uptake system ZnuABC Zn-binding protein ZnuA
VSHAARLQALRALFWGKGVRGGSIVVKTKIIGLVSLLGIALLASAVACGPDTAGNGQEYAVEPDELTPATLAAGERIQVVATTNIVGDVVHQVGGDRIALTVLMGIGVDPHSYVPTPSDTAALHDAQLIFANGAGLEANLQEMLQSTGGLGTYVEVSHGLDLLPAPAHEETAPTAGEHNPGDVDPHVWFSVPSVLHWVDNVEAALSARDPANASFYEARAKSYREELDALDHWIREQVAQVPEAHRQLVTNHPVFGYFAQRYGFKQLAAVYPFNPSSEPSARDIVRLQDAILQYGVPAIFAESTVNPRLARQVAEDTGVQIVPLYTGSLGGPGSGAESYIEMMRYDVRTIVEALKGGKSP